MWEVVVIEGDKVDVQLCFGFFVNGYDIFDVNVYIKIVFDKQLNDLLEVYESEYCFMKVL